RFTRVHGDVDFVALELEVQLEARRQMLFVLDHQEARPPALTVHCVAHSEVLVSAGRTIRMVVPFPGPGELASIFPPIPRTSEETTKSPSPVPRRRRMASSLTR